ncbi:PIG-L family deacetylase [Pelagicoccus sp. SDUM812005]|uniref:PIG-L family deacetylase n=1 Tax=Pelagicoccus sp. SDUM812005 TaxID=3041257 RepID=UPI00280CBA6A|nr:PIG-L family deacetylase [Pelagicoccus sp. SDUM812005]MDQ8183197.1 PIG-L family deacetylase [Pelagicoccus sp. SDUM812005]
MSLELFRNVSCYLLSLASATSLLQAQAVNAPEPRTGSEILWSLQKLDTLGRALYVAAHPDDENTNLISYLSLGRKYDTAYLSLTRGDGGQNLIGPELRDQLGVIRTQELLEARRVDGGQQFFSRAKDFGFSKHPDETLQIWDREAVLADTVWVIRNFQPDVLITRFGLEPGRTHGHHTASTILALEAFEAAADPSRFPEQLEFVDTWQAKRVVWNTSSWFFRNNDASFDDEKYARIDVGGFEPLLGKSYNEIASASRSKHLSQGFGTRIDRGSRIEYFEHLVGAPVRGDIFSGVDTTWARVEKSDTVQAELREIISSFDVGDPARSVPALLELRQAISELPDGSWALRKRGELDEIVLACMGLDLRALSSEQYVRNGDSMKLTLELINRSQVPAQLVGLAIPFAKHAERLGLELSYNERVEHSVSVSIGEDTAYPQPYWLEREGTLGMFDVEDQLLIGKAENDPAFYAEVAIEIMDTAVLVGLPISYREVDPAKGETIHPVLNLPAAAIEFANPVTLFPNYESRQVEVTISALLDDVEGRLTLDLPKGWSVEPSAYEVPTLRSGGTRSYSFTVTPRSQPEQVSIAARLSTNAGAFDQSVAQIEYDHIREQTVFATAATRAVSLEVARFGQRIGYLPGAGDVVPASIREIGYEVVELSAEGFDQTQLVGIDTVVVGIRAYNTVENIDAIMEDLFRFAEEGGTVLVQYNTNRGLKTQKFAPYPLSLSRDRVTDESAEVRVIAPEHPVMNSPNRITADDFDFWTQERGLYFPDSWDRAFTPVFSINDPGEPAREGSLLVAKHGKGYFVYTGISWFRQLPAGVPGAYRIFANLLSLGHEASSDARP